MRSGDASRTHDNGGHRGRRCRFRPSPPCRAPGRQPAASRRADLIAAHDRGRDARPQPRLGRRRRPSGDCRVPPPGPGCSSWCSRTTGTPRGSPILRPTSSGFCASTPSKSARTRDTTSRSGWGPRRTGLAGRPRRSRKTSVASAASASSRTRTPRRRSWPGATGRSSRTALEWLNADSEWRNESTSRPRANDARVPVRVRDRRSPPCWIDRR